MFSNNKPIIFKNYPKKVNKIIENYTFIHALSQSDITGNKNIFQNLGKSNFMMINRYTKQDEPQQLNKLIYIVIGFKKTIIICEQALIEILQPLITSKSDINICILSSMNNVKHLFSKESRIFEINDKIFNEEIEHFNSELLLDNSCNSEIKSEWKFIAPCISGYLIKESYEKLNINRIENFINFEKTTDSLETENKQSIEIPIIKEDEFIKLRNIDTSNKVELIYHIEREEIYVRKEQNLDDDEEIKKLTNREIENYSKFHHPFVPKLIGIGNNNEYLIIEYINGRKLQDIKELHFTFSEKITLFFEIMIVIEFLHRKHFIYRDLKPDNVMIDSNKTAVLIDFDRMIEHENSTYTTTKNFSSSFCAPEVKEINFSYECDIYSLGLVYLHIMNQNLKEFMESNENNEIKKIINKSLKYESKERPSIIELINIFYNAYYYDIQINNLYEIYMKKFSKFKEEELSFDIECTYLDINESNHYFKHAANQNHADEQFYLGFLYMTGKLVPRDMNKSLHYFTLAANQNHVDAQYKLGLLYMTDELISHDISKSLHYFTLAANQNHVDAQYKLGLLYMTNEFISHDIDKSIHYFTLAANQNHAKSQFNLGVLYERGELIPRDINKSIHYFTLAANQNDIEAQYNLGVLYASGKSVPRDMNKSIHYFTLAANQNYAKAQFNLGILYERGELIPRDINKSIQYYSLAANQNQHDAQYNLGVLYGSGKLVPRDINKSIHYFTLAANQNDIGAQYNLGVLYEQGELIPQDINKSIYYYSLAANQNHADAQFNLGELYESGELIPQDINKSIHYYTLSANQNNADAQLNLALIYISSKYVKRDIKKALYYLNYSANQNHQKSLIILAIFNLTGLYIKKNPQKGIECLIRCPNGGMNYSNFLLGYFYHIGLYVEQDIKKAIHYYKEASSFNYSLAKNNLGIIYRHGHDKENGIQLGWAIQYFEEAIKYGNHSISMYNLAHLYFYENPIENSTTKAIQLLLKSSYYKHYPSMFLLCIVILKEFGNNTDKIIEYFCECELFDEQLIESIIGIIKYNKLDQPSILEEKYEQYRYIDYIFDFDFLFSDLAERFEFIKNGIYVKEDNSEGSTRKDIDSNFYEGFKI